MATVTYSGITSVACDTITAAIDRAIAEGHEAPFDTCEAGRNGSTHPAWPPVPYVRGRRPATNGVGARRRS